MRWKTPEKEEFSERTRTIFLLFPTTARHKNEQETRWLEWARVREIYHAGAGYVDGWWNIVEFLE